MKIKCIYIAYNGKEFDSLAECTEYENHVMSLMNELNSHALLLDTMMHPILCPIGFNIEGMMTWFHHAYGNCSYININTELSNDLVDFIVKKLGLSFPPNKVGLYKYDYSEFRRAQLVWGSMKKVMRLRMI